VVPLQLLPRTDLLLLILNAKSQRGAKGLYIVELGVLGLAKALEEFGRHGALDGHLPQLNEDVFDVHLLVLLAPLALLLVDPVLRPGDASSSLSLGLCLFLLGGPSALAVQGQLLGCFGSWGEGSERGRLTEVAGTG